MTQQIESSKQEEDQSQSQDHQKKKNQINETTINNKQEDGDGDEDVLKFMDSLDAYLCLFDSLSSSLRQGWFDFAAARYSMGSSRVNTALLDLKEHSAATSLEVTKDDVPPFTLCKWTSCSARDANEMKDGIDGHESSSIRQRHEDTSQVSEAKEDSLPVGGPSAMTDDQVQKERSKSLAVFGKLVSPKLRAAQLSFETALETLVEIANMRASMLSAYDQVQEHLSATKN